MALDTTAIKAAIDASFPSAVPPPTNNGTIQASALRERLKAIVDFLATALDNATSTEALQDVVGPFLANSNISGLGMTYDDANNRMNISVLVPAMSQEEIQDMLATFAIAGSNVTVTYNDAANTLTISAAGATAYTDEQAQDAVAAMLAAGTHRGISVSYNDAGNSMSLDAGPAIVTIPASSTGATLTCTALDNRTNRTVLTGNVTFTSITIPANGQLVLFYQQAATGGPYSITFPGTIIWPSSTAPTMPTTANKHLRVTLTSDGTGIHGNYSSN